jgi:hypothetical protein
MTLSLLYHSPVSIPILSFFPSLSFHQNVSIKKRSKLCLHHGLHSIKQNIAKGSVINHWLKKKSSQELFAL